ncbi:MAG: ATP-binding protein [Chloroflexota bacterium]
MSLDLLLVQLITASVLVVAVALVPELVRRSGLGGAWAWTLAGVLLATLAAAAALEPPAMGAGTGLVGGVAVLLLAGLFYLPVPAAIAVVAAPAFVAITYPDPGMGGIKLGMAMVAAGVAGMGLRRLWLPALPRLEPMRLVLLGLVAGSLGAAWALLTNLPPPTTALAQVVRILVFLPIAVVIGGMLLSDGLRRDRERRALEDEARRLRLALESNGQRLFDFDVPAAGALTPDGEAPLPDTLADWISRVEPEDRAECLAAFADLVAGREAQVELEVRIRSRAGELRWIRSAARVLPPDGNGRPRRIVGTNADITGARAIEERERRQVQEHQRLLDEAVAARRALLSMVEDLRLAQDTLEESLDRYMALVRHSPDAIFVNRDDRVVLVNNAFLRLMGATDERQVLGMAALDLFDDASRPTVEDRIHVVRESREPVPVREVRLRRLDGSVVDVDAAGSPFEEHDGLSIHVVLRDISDRKRAERALVALNEELEVRVAERTAELQHAYRELESFSYSVSHDLRAPLRAITGFAQILERRNRDQLDESGRHYLDNISTAGERMGALIEDLLAYSRIGRREVRHEPLEVRTIAENVFGTLSPRVIETGASLYAAEPLASPLGDPVLFEQILLNLVSNGITYAREGVPPDVVVSSTQRADRVEVSVRDNGIGIAPEHRERVFEVFARLHAEDDIPGTGIGLAIVRKATRLLDGDIQLDSIPGEGTTFTISLPAAAAQPSLEPSSQVPA